MAVSIKSKTEIELMREAGRILAITHEELRKQVKPGMSTLEVDRIGEEIIRSFGCIPSFLNYNGYPASICVSINEEVVHGIPNKDRIIQEDDIVSLDAGVIYKGYHSDAARTLIMPGVSEEVKKLVQITKESFFKGIEQAVPGNHIVDIGRAIQEYVEGYGYSVVRDLIGHGVGAKLHEEPEVPNFASKRRGVKLCAGMTIAVEPMINLGEYDVYWEDDDWTVVTEDGLPSAHYENTILITDNGPEILSTAPGIEL
ncbi:MAG: type I methionyl aminopeptidase [Lachnospiraceae bacterium]|jgi:methionyl aminopeptidase|nr:type I methionyl aminopeptidase [Lachnospiraceae bacterium]MCR5702283.1 type I methionyl aminopeptidase [Lachnospiraceae bacterium]